MIKNIFIGLYLLAGLLIFSGCGQGTTQSPIPDNLKEDYGLLEKQANEEQSEVIEVADTIPVEQQGLSLPKMKVHYIDVGQADATLIEYSQDGEVFTILIDTGDWNATNVVSYLQAQNITEIDIIAVTHPHADHIGQLNKIINAFHVTEVWMNGETSDSQVFADALAAIENNGVDYYEPEVGELFDIGPLEVAVLHPKTLSGTTNNNSIAIRLQYGEISLLFTGDGEEDAENEMLSSGGNLEADILQVGHHGSKTSTTDRFLNAVKPDVAIYSAGENNQYGHPHTETINRLKKSGALVYGTDIHGTIIIETDGKTFSVHTNDQGTIKHTPPPVEIITEPNSDPEMKTPSVSSGSCVNINSASEAEIQRIIHIGPARSQDLIQHRPYQSVDDLTKIHGIGPARIKDILTQDIACTGG
ncbi:MAG TPA: MBL fold metallo-hydrolase [Sporosarcina psychrophila]|uniref:MBL fold metallo-hydrolase n=1 Tax=Sporosarcina psychrophila TaxID=1476 RepID=A0A921FXJ6_SPOPS|nr:MBL fold metallo-hydrolase [Sporosarcina psychrophila]